MRTYVLCFLTSSFFLLLWDTELSRMMAKMCKTFQSIDAEVEKEKEEARVRKNQNIQYTTFSVAPWCGPSCWGGPGNTARSRLAHHRVSVLAVDPWASTHTHTKTHIHRGTQKPLSSTASVAWSPKTSPTSLGAKGSLLSVCVCLHWQVHGHEESHLVKILSQLCLVWHRRKQHQKEPSELFRRSLLYTG